MISTRGERIKEMRKSLKLTQALFAHEIGISQTHVSKIEKNIENPSVTLVKFIAYRYNVSEEWLNSGTGSMHPEHRDGVMMLREVLKRYEMDIPTLFKNGDVMAISQMLNILYNSLPFNAKDHSNIYTVTYFPSQCIDDLSLVMSAICSKLERAYQEGCAVSTHEFLASIVEKIYNINP